ncbi:hypothetical protein C1645_839140 [Glomus cerebriforme]|uniref:T6SS Phospholipase effector Tle1-like catalytic domain-containing protein n=1 Tax=Glomus cerebriforme TaxID=658196 RepID=A0A397S793_9GLOM|nr:hypothetical protein C1645_839140 [Glomus cerebriforme]
MEVHRTGIILGERHACPGSISRTKASLTFDGNQKQNIFIFCDGTWNGPIIQSNVHRLYMELIKKVKEKSVTANIKEIKYEEGMGHGMNFLIDGALAISLDTKIKDIYSYIVDQYNDIVDQHNDTIYTIYRSRDSNHHSEGDESKKFKNAFSHSPTQCINLGLWDTVGAHGIPLGGIILPGKEKISHKSFAWMTEKIKEIDTEINLTTAPTSKSWARWHRYLPSISVGNLPMIYRDRIIPICCDIDKILSDGLIYKNGDWGDFLDEVRKYDSNTYNEFCKVIKDILIVDV